MAETDFTLVAGTQSATDVARGVTAGFPRPNGGGSFLFGFDAKVATQGAVVYYLNDSGGRTKFGPLKNDASGATGGSIRVALKRPLGAGPTDFAPFLFLGAGLSVPGAPDVVDAAYLLGLSDEDPHRIVLRKGAPKNGLGASGAAATGRLGIGSATFLRDGDVAPQKGGWLHLRLDCVVNPNGDVVLQAFQSDLAVNAVTAPIWVAVPGLVDFIDDALGIQTGSFPLIGPASTGGKFGYAGFGFYSKASGRQGFFDHFSCFRQK